MTAGGASRQRASGSKPPARIERDERGLITRVEIARLTGLSESALAGLYSRRRDSGHPEAVHRDGRWLYFDEDDVLMWHHRRQAAKKATLTEVDRTGDPNELLDRAAAARLLGYSGASVIDSYRARNIGYFPEPDARRPLRWRRATLWAFADRRSRPGRAGHSARGRSLPPAEMTGVAPPLGLRLGRRRACWSGSGQDHGVNGRATMKGTGLIDGVSGAGPPPPDAPTCLPVTAARSCPGLLSASPLQFLSGRATRVSVWHHPLR